MSADDLKVGVVGCGLIAQEGHIPSLLKCKNARLVAVCDMNRDRVESIARKFRISRHYVDFAEMLSKEKLDVIDVCTSINTHAPLSIQAMEAGCHVLVEKPLALSVGEVGEQVRILAESFGVERVTVVGDRGMLKQVQTDALNEKGFHYITAITKAQIKRLLREDVFQMELFEGEICEVESEGVRYILRRNPQRAEEVRSTREGKLARVKRLVDKRNLYLAEHRQARIETAVRAIEAEVERLRIGEWVKVVVNERALGVRVDEGVKEEVGRLDGCYVIKTDLPAEVATAETVHARYKDLTQVERAFRTFKSGGLEVRPAFVRREESTRGHVFVVMLAYLVERELERCWRGLETTVPEGIDELGSLRAVEIEAGGARCQKVPKATGSSDQLLEAADIHLPEMLPLRSVHVATRKKLVSRRLVS